MAITILTISNFFGQFMATYYIMFVDKLVGPKAATTLGSVGVSFVILAICTGIWVFNTKKKNEELMQSLSSRAA
jgi:hypothetical protein